MTDWAEEGFGGPEEQLDLPQGLTGVASGYCSAFAFNRSNSARSMPPESSSAFAFWI